MGTDADSVRLESISVASLSPHPRNPREHPDSSIQKLKQSIESFGWTNPIIARPDGTILAGHARLKAARDLGRATVPVITVDLEDDEAEAYMLADNRLQEETDWDEEALSDLMHELDEQDLDLTETGFDPEQIEALLSQTPAPDDLEEDAVPEPPEKPTTDPGDLWRLGEHRLLCADATDAASYQRLLQDESADLCVTDPPYGVQVDHGWRDEVKNRTPSPRSGEIEGDQRADWQAVYEHLEAPVLYIWHASTHAGTVKQALEDTGYEVRQQIIWIKAVHALSRSHYHWQHEPCWYAVREDAQAHWRGGRDQTTVWEHPSPIMSTSEATDATDHPTQKPLEVYATPIRNHTLEDDILIDPFAGSGTGLSACEQMNRRFRGIEVDPRWCDVIVERWETLTGQTAERTVHREGATS